jgi:predicted XRE-type DNA-binding protein
LLALLGAHRILHVSRIRVNDLMKKYLKNITFDKALANILDFEEDMVN